MAALTAARRWRVGLGIGGVLLAAGIAAGLVAVTNHRPSHQSLAVGPTRNPVSTSGCGPLGLRLRTAAGRGQSVVTGYGHLTGTSRVADGARYREFRLTGVHTLVGPVRPAELTAWLTAPPGRPAAAADAPGLWAPDGRLVALLTPAATARTATGPIASIAPLVGDRVILSSAGCWSDPALTGTPFTGQLAEVPGSDTYRLAEQAGGFVGYPLADLVRLAGR